MVSFYQAEINKAILSNYDKLEHGGFSILATGSLAFQDIVI